MSEYQPRTPERLVEILRSQDQNPRSWQQEAAREIGRLRSAAQPQAAREPELDKFIVRFAVFRKAVEASRAALADGAFSGPLVDDALRLIDVALSQTNPPVEAMPRAEGKSP